MSAKAAFKVLAMLVLAQLSPAASMQESHAAFESGTPVAAPNKENRFLNSIQVSGFVDGYWGYNFNQPPSQTNQLRNFDFRDKQFSLNLAEIALMRAPEPFGFRLDVNYGPKTTKWIHSTDPAESDLKQYIQQLYVGYKARIGKGLTLDLGKFVTQHGAEVIETKDNWNYSRSLLFAWAIPYYHFGLRVGYPLQAKLTINAHLVNGWNNNVDNNRGKTLGLQGVWTPHAKVTVVQNYMIGPEQSRSTSRIRHLYDAVITYTATDKLTLMLNYDYAQDRANSGQRVFWTGAGGYARYVLTPSFTLAPRFEWFNDHNGFSTGQAQKLTEGTLTGELKVNNNLIARLEYRYDHSNILFFQKGSGNKRSQATTLLGLFCVFSM